MALRPIRIDAKLFLGPHDERRSVKGLLSLLLGLTHLNEGWLDAYGAPRLYDTNVLYKAERNTEHWADIPTVLGRGYGDCEDLACWRSAELRAEGVEASPMITWRQVGKRKILHVIVEYPDGRREDPSRALGMHGHPITRAPVFI